MLLETADLIVWEMFYKMSEDGVVMIPSFDAALSKGEVDDRGRILRVELDWNKDDVDAIAKEFKKFAQSIFEIGDWYSNSGSPFGVKPDENFMAEKQSMNIWAKYIRGYNDFNSSTEGIIAFSKEHGISGKIGAVLAFMVYRYCFYASIDAPEVIMDSALIELAHVFVLNRYARKIEQIDMLMDEYDPWSYFPLRKHLTLDDFKKIAFYLESLKNIPTDKGRIFFDKTRTDKDTETLYNELLNMDV